MEPKLLDILACPACQGDLAAKADKLVCQNASCRREFPVQDGIPILILEEARQAPGA